MSAEKITAVMACYGILHYAFQVAIPIGMAQLAEVKSSIKRIKELLLTKQAESFPLYTEHIADPRIIVKNLSAKITSDQPVLQDITLEFKKGLYAITGPVACGKSNLLKIFLHDVVIVEGKSRVTGSISYSSQEPWVFPGTVKQNILFGRSLDVERYRKVIDICGLAKDINSFKDGDNTLVSDRGLNLSRGQQARVNLARAVYRDADIYLLDSPLSALDINVSKRVFGNCIKEYLRDKVVLLVTQQEQFIKEADKVVMMNDGKVEAIGTHEELIRQGFSFGSDLVEDNVKSDTIIDNIEKNNMYDEVNETTKLLESSLDLQEEARKLYTENKKDGGVDPNVYKRYFKFAGGWKRVSLLIFILTIAQAFSSGFDYFISYW